jgi:hypothetical protein
LRFVLLPVFVNSIDTVLFNIDGTSIVDESDNFFGEGNNGRDCIRKSDTYPFDLTSCFFQNNQQYYTADEYLKGTLLSLYFMHY